MSKLKCVKMLIVDLLKVSFIAFIGIVILICGAILGVLMGAVTVVLFFSAIPGGSVLGFAAYGLLCSLSDFKSNWTGKPSFYF